MVMKGKRKGDEEKERERERERERDPGCQQGVSSSVTSHKSLPGITDPITLVQ